MYSWSTDKFILTEGTEITPLTMAGLLVWAKGQGGDAAAAIDGEVVSSYVVRADIEIGNGVDSTWFTSLNEMIYFTDGYTFQVKSSAVFQLGQRVGDYGINGSSISVSPVGTYSIIPGGHTGTFLCYDSKLKIRSSENVFFYSGYVDIRDGVIEHNGTDSYLALDATLISLILENVCIQNIRYLKLEKTPDLMVNVRIRSSHFGLLTNSDIVVNDLHITEFGNSDYFTQSSSSIITLNPQSPVNTPTIASEGNSIIEQYSVNIHTTDKDGAALSDVSIAASYAHVVLADDGNNYICIVPFTAIDDEFKPYNGTGDWASKWELFTTTDDDFVGGIWQYPFSYKTAAIEFDDSMTNANGDMIGGELIRNGDFEMGALFEWTADAGWVVNGSNQAVGTATWGDSKNLSQNFGGVIGNDYEFKYDVIACDLDQSFRMSSDSIFGDIKLPKTVGTHTLILTAVNNSSTFDLYVFVSSLNTTGRSITIDNVSVRQVGQVVQYKKWIGTNPDLETRVHKLTFGHADYPDFVMSNKIMKKPTDWEVQLERHGGRHVFNQG